MIAEEAPVSHVAVRLRVPEGLERGRDSAAARAALQEAFGVEVRAETREVDAFELRLAGGDAPRPRKAPRGFRPSPPVGGAGPGRRLRVESMKSVADVAWNDLGVPVFDETGLAGYYELHVAWPDKDRAAMERALASAGLALRPARREAEFLRVARAAPPR